MATNTLYNPAPESGLKTPGIDTNALMQQLIQKQLGGSGLVSSATSPLDSVLAGAVSAQEKQGAAREAQINLDYQDAVKLSTDRASYELSAGRAAGSGGVLNLAALNELTGRTDSTLKDLEKQKQQALLNNDSATATAVTNLQIKAVEFQQEANQKIFSQILQLGQYGIQQKNQEIAQKAAADEHTKIIGDLITENPQAGISPTDSIDQAYTKIGKNPNSPDALLKKAQIAKIYNDINVSNRKDVGGGTLEERKASAISSISSAFTPGATYMSPEGFKKTVLDQNGYVTPEAWKLAIKAAPSKGLDRTDFIKQFGYLVYSDNKNGVDARTYGLTPQELKLINS